MQTLLQASFRPGYKYVDQSTNELYCYDMQQQHYTGAAGYLSQNICIDQAFCSAVNLNESSRMVKEHRRDVPDTTAEFVYITYLTE